MLKQSDAFLFRPLLYYKLQKDTVCLLRVLEICLAMGDISGQNLWKKCALEEPVGGWNGEGIYFSHLLTSLVRILPSGNELHFTLSLTKEVNPFGGQTPCLIVWHPVAWWENAYGCSWTQGCRND